MASLENASYREKLTIFMDEANSMRYTEREAAALYGVVASLEGGRDTMRPGVLKVDELPARPSLACSAARAAASALPVE